MSGEGGASEVPVLLSVQLRLAGRRCVVVGGGAVGARRAATLCSAGAEVTVIAPDIHDELVELATAGIVEVVRRDVEPDDLAGAALVVAATGRPEVDRWVGEEAASRGIPVNRADDAAAGDVLFPAVVRRGPLSVAVSTGGRAPAAARLLASMIGEGLDVLTGLDERGVSELVEIVEEVRAELRGGPGDVTERTREPMNWRTALDESILELIRRGRRAEAKERLLACLSSS